MSETHIFEFESAASAAKNLLFFPPVTAAIVFFEHMLPFVSLE